MTSSCEWVIHRSSNNTASTNDSSSSTTTSPQTPWIATPKYSKHSSSPRATLSTLDTDFDYTYDYDYNNEHLHLKVPSELTEETTDFNSPRIRIKLHDSDSDDFDHPQIRVQSRDETVDIDDDMARIRISISPRKQKFLRDWQVIREKAKTNHREKKHHHQRYHQPMKHSKKIKKSKKKKRTLFRKKTKHRKPDKPFQTPMTQKGEKDTVQIRVKKKKETAHTLMNCMKSHQTMCRLEVSDDHGRYGCVRIEPDLDVNISESRFILAKPPSWYDQRWTVETTFSRFQKGQWLKKEKFRTRSEWIVEKVTEEAKDYSHLGFYKIWNRRSWKDGAIEPHSKCLCWGRGRQRFYFGDSKHTEEDSYWRLFQVRDIGQGTEGIILYNKSIDLHFPSMLEGHTVTDTERA